MLAQSLFLDRLHLVAGNPLTYVAFIFLVLAWVGRWYFLRTRKYLESLSHLPDADKLAFAQMVVLGFPKTLTKGRLKVIQWRYLLIAFLATLLSLALLAGLAVHYWSLTTAEVNEQLGRIAVATERMAKRLDQIDHVRDELKDLQTKHSRLVVGLAGAEGRATALVAFVPEIRELRDHLKDLLQAFVSDIEAVDLSEVDLFRVRLAEGALANADFRFDDALELVTETEAEQHVEAAADVYKLRGDAYYGLRRSREALTQYELADQFRPDDVGTQVRLALCLFSLGRLDEAIERFDALVQLYRELVEVEGGAEFAANLARSLDNRAIALRKRGDFDRSFDDNDRAINIFTRLVETEGRSEIAADLARSLSGRSIILDHRGELDQSLDDIDRAVNIFTRLIETEGRSELAADLARSLSIRAITLKSAGELDRAFDDMDRAVNIFTRLVETEGRAEIAASLAWSLTVRAVILDDPGELDRSLDDMDRSINILTRLVETEERAEFAEFLGRSLGFRAIALLKRGELDRSLDDMDRSINILTRLVETEERAEFAEILLGRNLGLRAIALLERGELDRSLDDMDRAINIFTRLVETEERAEFAEILGKNHALRAIALLKRGELDRSLDDIDRAINILTRLVEEGQVELRTELESLAAIRAILEPGI